MRRRSAGARAGNALAARGQLAGRDLALWLARAHIIYASQEIRVLQFAVYSCNAAHASTELARTRTTSKRSSRPPALLGLAGTLAAIPCAPEPREHPPTHWWDSFGAYNSFRAALRIAARQRAVQRFQTPRPTEL
jgi:hypothetical protein